MTRDEHLYTIAGEECAELAQRFSKALRFGGHEIQPGQHLDNRTRILEEFADLLAMMEMLQFSSVVQPGNALRVWMDRKKEKVERFLQYSAEVGSLTT